MNLILLIITILVLIGLAIKFWLMLGENKECGKKIISEDYNYISRRAPFDEMVKKLKKDKLQVFVRHLYGDTEIIEMDKFTYAIHHAALILNRHLVFKEMQVIKPKKQFKTTSNIE